MIELRGQADLFIYEISTQRTVIQFCYTQNTIFNKMTVAAKSRIHLSLTLKSFIFRVEKNLRK